LPKSGTVFAVLGNQSFDVSSVASLLLEVVLSD
jgi:hypothetical protein